MFIYMYGFMIHCFVELCFALSSHIPQTPPTETPTTFLYIYFPIYASTHSTITIRYVYVFSLDLNTMLSGFIMYSIHIWWLFNNHIHFSHFLKAALGGFLCVFFSSSSSISKGCENICVCCNIMYHIFDVICVME